ncbi:Cohesin subunit SA-3 [Phytophthora citrophthora]|uniref:Cohesin subunit SA-3 n=1 Tax=Phytophthora citrophthora TaxID=4793 RepID=A0AAD9GG31_9STRA|nr:Cohesin subunit SA-3 [Phytophthora citrophthora]
MSPTPIYHVEDTRNGEEVEAAGAEEQDPLAANGHDEESSGEERLEAEDEEFTPSGTKKPKLSRKVARTPVARARSTRRKRSPWSQTRSLRLTAEDRKSKKNTATAEAEGTGIDNEHAKDGDALFEALKSGKVSLENLVGEWRDRFEENGEKATREVLDLVLQACGGSGQYVPESEPLDQLDMSDLVDHVVDDLERANGVYPIMSRGRGMGKFQRTFEEFWEAFVKECYESEILFTSDVASNFIDWLTTLSSSELRPIRHTATVAVLALSNSMVRTAVGISEQLAVATRQLNAETKSPNSTPDSQKSLNMRKVVLLKDNKTLYESRLQQVLKLVDVIFTGVVVHRYRDVMPEIRVATMQCLGHWIITLPDHFLKDNFLKYLGWLLSDKSAAVRVEVVQILCELYGKDSHDKLELFTSRFLPRYLELCNDVDEGVVEECIHLLIAVDKHNLISSDIELQPVEKLVFDAEHENIRKAAAEFVCLQYDAFGVAVSKSKTATLKKEQLNTQAIALVEFAEEYIQNYGVPEGAVETLVDAFWGLEDCLVLQDWRLMTDLLLVDKSAPDLSSEQQTILLRLLVASVRKLVGEGDNRPVGAAAKREAEQLQEEITVAYCKDIPSLFSLYQADSDKLALLLELVPMLSLKSEVIGHHSGHIKELLEKLKHAFLLHSDEELLTSLSLSVTHLLQTEHTSLKREAETRMHELVQGIMDKFDRLDEADLKLYDTLASSGKDTPRTRNKKGGKKRKAVKAKEISDVEYGLRIALCRIKCLTRYLNLREYLPPEIALSGDNTTTHQGRMDRFVVALGDLLRRRSTAVCELDEAFRHVDTIKHGLTIIYSDLLWATTPIFKTIEEDKKNDNTSGATTVETDVEGDSSIQIQIEKVCQSRSTLEEALISVLEMHLVKPKDTIDDEHKNGEETPDSHSFEAMEEAEFEDEGTISFVREAQQFAFLTFCDVRCLFIEKFQEAKAPYSALDWALPKVLVFLTQMHFEREMDNAEEEEPEFEDDMAENDPVVAKEKADAMREWGEKQQRKAELLVALGRVSLCNPSKKHQAASVLQYFTSSGKSSVEVVKAFGKQVKTDAPVRYLEIQMTALRQMFSSILVWKQDIETAQASRNNNDDEAAELEELRLKVESSEQDLKELAKRLSQSLGVGKIPLSLRAPFLRFVREGVRYAMEHPTQFEFLETMRIYMGHLDNSSLAQLREYFMEQLNGLRDVPDDSEDLDKQWRVLFDFQSSLSSDKVANGRKQAETMMSPPMKSKRRSASSEPTPMQGTSIPEESEEEKAESNHAEEAETEVAAAYQIGSSGDDSQLESSTHKRITVAGDDPVLTDFSIPPRKRPRRHREDDESKQDNDSNDHQHQDESKNGSGASDPNTFITDEDQLTSRSKTSEHKRDAAADGKEEEADTRRKRRRV